MNKRDAVMGIGATVIKAQNLVLVCERNHCAVLEVICFSLKSFDYNFPEVFLERVNYDIRIEEEMKVTY